MADKEWSDSSADWSDDDVTYDGHTRIRDVPVVIHPFLGIVEDVVPDGVIAFQGTAGVTLGAPGPESDPPAASAVHGDGVMFLSEDGILLDASQSIGYTH